MSIKKLFSFVPNLITSFNVLSGSLSVVLAFEGHLVLAGILIFVAAFFDYFDGMSARLLEAYSDMGKELDSLADMVSFGLAPAIIAHKILRMQLFGDAPLGEISTGNLLLVVSPLVIVAFSALRLAKFNIDTRQTESFIGLNTPSNAMVWASFPFILAIHPNSLWSNAIQNPLVIIALSVVMSLLLVSELPMFSLKFKNLSFAKNRVRFLFLGLCILLLALFNVIAIPLIIFSYLIISAAIFIIKK